VHHRRKKQQPFPDIDWSTVDYVVGTRDDVTLTGIHRPCSRCGQSVFTSRRYPIEVAMVCEVCALELVEEDRKTGASNRDALPFASGGAWATDPTRRPVGSPARRRGPRKLGTRPAPPAGDGAGAE
jgi:hypothetical protein